MGENRIFCVKEGHRLAVTAQLISVFVCYTDSTILLLLIPKISSLQLSAETVQAGLCQTSQ